MFRQNVFIRHMKMEIEPRALRRVGEKLEAYFTFM